MTRRLHHMVLASVVLAACAAPGAQREKEATSDFGLPAAAVAKPVSISGSVLVSEVAAPEWLDSPGLVYRLVYDDDARTRIYARSRWTAPPASLVTQRLRAAVAAATGGRLVLPEDAASADWVLRVELEAFSQVFETPDRSRALVRMRATLVRTAARQVVAQRTFGSELAATSANAPGGARALARGADEVVDAIVVWVAQQTK